jgi:hypothetical protein
MAFAVDRVYDGRRNTFVLSRTQRDVWWGVLGLCMFVLLGNCATQTAYIIFGPTWPKNTWQANVLRYIGFGRLDGVIDYVLFFVPYFGIAVAGASKLYNDRMSQSELDGPTPTTAPASSQKLLLRLTVGAASVAAVTVPSVSSIVYLLFVVSYFVSELRKGSGNLKFEVARERLLNLPFSAAMGCLCYTAIHFMTIYMYQLPELQSAARESSAQLLGLYSMDRNEGPVARLLRLTQIISIGVLFMGLCALEANCGESVVEHEDDIRRPLMEDDAQSDVPDALGRDIIVDRLLARFGGILGGFALLLVGLLVSNIVAYPMLLVGLVLIVHPVRHKTFAKIHGPLIFTYLVAWTVGEYILLCIPPIVIASMNSRVRALLEAFGALPARDGEQSGVNACYMGILLLSLVLVGWLTKNAKNTPTDDELEEHVQNGTLTDYIPLDDLEIEQQPAESAGDLPLVQLISHLLVPFALWIVALSRADFIHAALLLAFLFNIVKPGDRTILHLTAQILAGIIAVLYFWAITTRIGIFSGYESRWKSTLGLVGLDQSSTIHTTGPFACILVVICIVLYLQKVLNALTPESEPAETTSQGTFNAITSLGKALLYEFSSMTMKLVARFGAYFVLLVGLATLEVSKCSLINLVLLALLGLNCIVKRHPHETDSRRWRPILLYCLCNLAVRYTFGAFPLDKIFGFSSDLTAFLENTVGLAQNVEPGKLMSELLGPSILLVFTYFHEIGLLSLTSSMDERRSLPLAATELGFLPLVKRAIILHANKVVTICTILFVLERRDLLGLLMLAALIASTLSMKTTEGPTELVGTIALVSAIMDYAYKIQWMQQGEHWSILPVLGAHKWPESSLGFVPENESMLRYPVLVIFSVELTKVTRGWLSKLPPALKSGCSPEPCHLFWPQRDTRTVLMKRKAEMIESSVSMDSVNVSDDEAESDSLSDLGDNRSNSGSDKARIEFTKRIQENARTNFGQLAMMLSIVPELIEGLMANLMPGLLYVVFAIVGIASTNILSLLYLGVTWKLANSKLGSYPRDRLLLWRSTTMVCALIVLWQYAVSIEVIRSGVDGLTPPPPPSPPPALRSLLSVNSEKLRLTRETKQWLAVLPCSKMMLFGYFSAFFIAACQLRMDAILAGLEERARLTIEASQAEGEDMDDQMVAELVSTMIPRQTPTQTALLPAQAQETSYMDIVFAPLSWEASATWTLLEWLRYFYLRYAVEWALVSVIVLGTFSRDLIHIGYLILPFYFLRSRNALSKDGQTGLRLLQIYNITVIGAVLLYQAPMEALLGSWYGPSDSECSFLQGMGFYKLPTVLGVQAGQLTTDLFIFGVVHLLRSIITQPKYKAAMVMMRQSIEAQQIVNDALKHGWVRESLSACLAKMKEKDNRRRRVEDIRDEITTLSREILAVESRREDGPRRHTGDRKPPSDTLRRRRGQGGDPGDHAGEWMEEDVTDYQAFEDDPPREEADSNAENIHEYEMNMRKSLQDKEKTLTTLLHIWLMDKSSTFGLVFGAFLKTWPWIAAPHNSMSYFFMILSFAIDFSLVTIVFPTSILAYGLMAYPKVPHGFWRLILYYAESILLIGYILTIPCTLQCTDVTMCSYVPLIFGISTANGAFIPNVIGAFMAYVAVMIHHNAQQTLAHVDNTKTDGSDDEDDKTSFAIDAIFSRLKNFNIDGTYQLNKDAESSPLHIEVSRSILAEADNFFQRILTQEAEYGPSFVSVSVLSGQSTPTDWDDITARMNEALVSHQMLSDAAPSTYYTLEFVQADTEGLQNDPEHSVAIFRILTSTSLLCPSAEVSNTLKALQLREAAGEADTPPLGLTSVRGFHQEGQDFYTATLCFDILATIFVAIFYQSTVDSDSDALVETYYQGLFKIDYVLSVFVCLVLIVADGVIYMKKAKVAKVFYHYLTYAGFVAFLLRIFHSNTTTHHSHLQLFFLVKSVSFALGARQIRSGFPTEVFTNSLIFQRSDIISFGAFMTYFSIPFMYELRILLEYACTDSALDLYDWLKLENISRDLFRINVRNNTYRKYHPFGEPQPWWKKVFLEGGGLFTIIFSLLVVPFFVFSTSNPQVDINPVYDVRFNMSLIGAENTFTYPIFDGGFRKTIESTSWQALRTDAPKPLINKPGQIQEVCLAQDSDSVWSTPPPSIEALKKSLSKGASLNTGWIFKRHLPLDNPILYSDGIDYEFSQEEAEALIRVINGEQNNVFLEDIYPRVWHLHGKGKPVPKYSSEQSVSCTLALNGINSTAPWWSVDCGTYVAVKRGASADGRQRLNWWQPCHEFENGPEIVLISSEVPTGVFATFSQFVGGLTGVYVVYILTLASIVRGFTNNLVGSIQHIDLPSTHRLISLCSDIYSARQVRDFVLEERLYWLLIRIYRSPAVLFEFTRTSDGSAMPLRPMRPKTA